MFELSKRRLDYIYKNKLDYSRRYSPEVRRAIASAENTSAEVLKKLSKDPDAEVRGAVASSPNTPIEILEKLGEEFPEEIINNSIFNLILLENPDSRFIQLSLARSSTTPKETLAQIAETADQAIILAIAHNASTPQKTLIRLLLEMTLAQQELINEDQISSSTERIIDSYGQILWAIANNINTPIDALKHHGSWLVHKVAENPNTSLQILENLANDEDNNLRVKVARNPSSSLQLLEILASDQDLNVKEIAKQNLAAKLL